MSIRVEPQALEAVPDRAPDAFGAVVEHDVPARRCRCRTRRRGRRAPGGRRPCRVSVASGATTRRPTFVDSTNSSRGRPASAAPIRRSADAVPVQRRDVEGADPERPGVAHDRDRVGVGHGPVQPADRGATEAEPGGRRLDRPSGIRSNGSYGMTPRGDAAAGAPSPVDGVRSPSVSFNQSVTGQYTEQERGLRLISVRSGSVPILGVQAGERWLPASRARSRRRPRPWPSSSTAVPWPSAPCARRPTTTRIVRDGRPLAEAELLAPVPRPGKVVAIGRNYREHAGRGGRRMRRRRR